MTIWIKRDVQGDLQPIVAKAVGKIAKIYMDEVGEDFFITSKREGIHSLSSLHPEGWAFDFKLPVKTIERLKTKIREVLGINFDIVEESDHGHCEYDPKGV